MKNKIATIGIIIATLILAGVAVFTAVRLYELRKEAVAPTAPTSKPKAQEVPIACTALSFTLGQTPTPTPEVTSTPTPTTTGIPNSCNGTCGSDSNCLAGYYFCYNGRCRDRSCPAREDCTCPKTPTPTLSPTPTLRLTVAPKTTSTPTPTQPSLPSAGTSLPTVFAIGIGTLLLVGALVLAL